MPGKKGVTIRMNNKRNEQEIKKEKFKDLAEDAINYSRARAMAYRVLCMMLICVGMVFFIGVGNRQIVHYVVLFVIMAASYYCGRSDMRQSIEEKTVLNLKELLESFDNVEISLFDEIEDEFDEDN